MADNELLKLEGVSKRFGGTYALSEVDLVVREGEFHGLIGENGAGKSTLIKIITGAQRRDAGRISAPALGRADADLFARFDRYQRAFRRR